MPIWGIRHGLEEQRGGNHGQMRARNRRTLLNLIRLSQSISRADLVAKSGLTKGAVSNIVIELIQDQLVREIKMGKSTGGRRPTLLKLAAEANLVGAIDIRPRLTTLAVATLDGHIIRHARIRTASTGPEAFLMHCVQQVQDMMRQFTDRTLVGIGLVVPGHVTPDGQGLLAQTELGWPRLDATSLITQAAIPIVLAHQGHAVALAELVWGSALPNDTFISLLTQSDTISAGLVLHGTVLLGPNRQAGSIQHMIINWHGERSRSGRRGTLGVYASGEGLARRYQGQNPYQHLVQQEAAAVHDLTVTSAPGSVRLRWQADLPLLSHFAVYRHTEQPVPLDDVHCVGLTTQCQFTYHSMEAVPSYFTVAVLDAQGWPSRTSRTVLGMPAPPEQLFTDTFTPEWPTAYTVDGPVPPQITPEGMLTGNDSAEQHHTWVYRDDGLPDATVLTATMRPVSSGIHDTCGLLFKFRDKEHWYCAALAYGSELASTQTLSLMRQSGSSLHEWMDEWLGFYEMPIILGQDYHIKVLLHGQWVRAKAWPTTEPEPSDWQIVLEDDTDWTGGAIGFRCYGQHALLHALKAEAITTPQIDPEPHRAQDSNSTATIRLLIERALQGERLAIDMLHEMGEAIGSALNNLHVICGAEQVLYCGELAEKAWPILEQGLLRVLPAGHPLLAPDAIRASTLGPNATLRGAVALASELVFYKS